MDTDAPKIEAHYIDLVFPLIGSLYAEALIIGVFVVGFGMLRRSLATADFLKDHSLYQRALLLLVIMIWTANLHASYGLYGKEASQSPGELSVGEAHVLADLTRIMIPLEITATIVTALMFGAIAFRDYAYRSPGGSGVALTPTTNLRREISLLFWLAACLHLLFMLWFVIVFGVTGRIQPLGSFFGGPGGGAGWDASPAAQPVSLNIAFHLFVAAAYVAASFLWRLSARGDFYGTRFRLWDWVGVLAFGAIMIRVYWFRLGQYIANMGSS